MSAEPRFISPRLLEGPPDLSVPMKGIGRLGREPRPVQREVWTLLEAKTPLGLPLHRKAVVEVPRRAGKTDSILALLMGRCESIPGYQAAYAAQDGVRSRKRFRDLLRNLRIAQMQGHPGMAGIIAYRSRGEEYLRWEANESCLYFIGPDGSAMRGDALDCLVLDEAQETDPEFADELLGSVLPIFDTRPDAQLVVSGTAGPVRAGLLWDNLVKGRAGDGWGVLEYSAPDDADIEDEQVWIDTHPGPAVESPDGLVGLMRERRDSMSPVMFAREYLGIFPSETSLSVFSSDVWQRCGSERIPQPTRVGVAFDVMPSGNRSAVMVAWRDGEQLWVEVVRDEPGYQWVADFVAALARKFHSPVGYDAAGITTINVAEDIARRHKGIALRGLTTKEMASSCVTFASSVLSGNLRHSRQPTLDEAARVATQRKVLDGWCWGRSETATSIAPLVGATVAARVYDDMPQRVTTIITARTA